MVKGIKILKTLLERSGCHGYASWFVCLKYVSLRQNSTKSPLTELSNYLACGKIKKSFSVAVLLYNCDGLKSGRRINDFILYNIIILYTIHKICKILGSWTSALRSNVAYYNNDNLS